jgi:hypothetical protein
MMMRSGFTGKLCAIAASGNKPSRSATILDPASRAAACTVNDEKARGIAAAGVALSMTILPKLARHDPAGRGTLFFSYHGRAWTILIIFTG